jgi:hypothetical protein
MNPDEAQQFLAQRIFAQADRERMQLSRTEQQILLFSDAELPENTAILEARLASLIARTAEQLSMEERLHWDQAVQVLEAEGTYMNTLLIASRSVVDWARIRRIAIRAILTLIAINYLTRLASRWI